ncbi:myb-like protein D [Gordionus sp. m RMFG-2023]|uniref:myb-like protein D n=1 Tax=Gordionus sp. m RMFG-2023 TaxID=3053472 RepID=UPI0031FC4AD2
MEVFSTKPDRLESSREYLDRLKACGSGLNSELLAIDRRKHDRLRRLLSNVSLEINNKKSFIEKDTWRKDDKYGSKCYTTWNKNKHNGRTYNNSSNNNNNNNSRNNNNNSNYNNFKKTEMIQTPYNLRLRNKINFNDIMIDLQIKLEPYIKWGKLKTMTDAFAINANIKTIDSSQFSEKMWTDLSSRLIDTAKSTLGLTGKATNPTKNYSGGIKMCKPL